MNDRERWVSVLLFEEVDRIPFEPGYGRESTLRRWHQEGLPPDVADYHAWIRKMLHIPSGSEQASVCPGVDFTMIPRFEEMVIERRPAPAGSQGPGSLIVRDWKGNICEISDAYDVTYLQSPRDFVTRSWLKCPVESRTDWADMKRRYIPDDPRRFPADYSERCPRLRDRDYPSSLTVNGPFWQLREWMGFENLCMAMLDDEPFVREMIEFWDHYIGSFLRRVFQDYVPDLLIISEDMAYKEKPMIGPDMARKLLLPTWTRWTTLAHDAGVKVVDMDSDGHVGMLIPLWIEAGINSNSPLEVAAGNDLPALRRRFGRNMAYRGGVDKRCMAAGGEILRREITRLRPVIDSGGYIPGCDHGVPHDVSWQNYLDYCRLLAQATRWL
ncbi:MAG: uroporphyrinogen decarboxylase/cobalamine-independent methonine synthase family protein [Phycisphaerales bacterium]